MEEKIIGGTFENERTKFLARTYGWMAFALLVSAVCAFAVTTSDALIRLLFSGGMGFVFLAIAELVLVLVLSLKIRTLKVSTASFFFVLYSALNGLTLSSIFFVYDLGSIFICFVSAAAMFLGMSIYGLKTKKDLNTLGRYCMMGLWGVIVSSLLFFVFSWIFPAFNFTMIDLGLSILMVFIFLGLSAYDTQKILRTSMYSNGSDDYKKVAILGALELYLDFINIFLRLLYLFGKRRD